MVNKTISPFFLFLFSLFHIPYLLSLPDKAFLQKKYRAYVQLLFPSDMDHLTSGLPDYPANILSNCCQSISGKWRHRQKGQNKTWCTIPEHICRNSAPSIILSLLPITPCQCMNHQRYTPVTI